MHIRKNGFPPDDSVQWVGEHGALKKNCHAHRLSAAPIEHSHIENVDCSGSRESDYPQPNTRKKPRFFRSVRAAPAWRLDTISMRIRSRLRVSAGKPSLPGRHRQPAKKRRKRLPVRRQSPHQGIRATQGKYSLPLNAQAGQVLESPASRGAEAIPATRERRSRRAYRPGEAREDACRRPPAASGGQGTRDTTAPPFATKQGEYGGRRGCRGARPSHPLPLAGRRPRPDAGPKPLSSGKAKAPVPQEGRSPMLCGRKEKRGLPEQICRPSRMAASKRGWGA